ncbi:MAG: hypothetical protein U0X40_11110 [Ferruginibacter sp.]
MKSFLLSFLLFNGFPLLAQMNTRIHWNPVTAPARNDTIYYNPQGKLKWDDFKGKANYNSDALAVTYSGFGYSMMMTGDNRQTTLDINVSCFFSKRGSWVKAGLASDYALLHEQHHFDITYIATHLFVAKLKAARFTPDNYESLLEQLYQDAYAELNRLQDLYDGQTRNGRDKEKQAGWNKKIDDWLKDIAKE